VRPRLAQLLAKPGVGDFEQTINCKLRRTLLPPQDNEQIPAERVNSLFRQSRSRS